MAGTIYLLDPQGWGREAAVGLRGAGFVVLSVPCRDEAERLLRRRPPDHLIVVDSPQSPETPAFVHEIVDTVGAPVTLVADAEDEERLLDALDAGATDVVPLDCSPGVLLARVRAVLRRTGGLPPDADEPITIGAVTHLPAERRALVGGQSVHLTPIENALLRTFMRDPGVVYAREDLLEAIWGARDVALERTIDAHVWKLRRKIEPDASHPQYIFSVQGLGYRFRRPDAEPALAARAG